MMYSFYTSIRRLGGSLDMSMLGKTGKVSLGGGAEKKVVICLIVCNLYRTLFGMSFLKASIQSTRNYLSEEKYIQIHKHGDGLINQK